MNTKIFTQSLRSLTLLCLILLGTSSAWGVNYETLFTVKSADVVSNSTYAKYEKTIEKREWIITFGGNNKSVGTNSGNRTKCNLGSYTKYAVSPVKSSDVASAFVSLTSISDVSKISYTFNGGSGQTSTNVYLIYSADGTTFSQMTLTSGTQGATISSGTAYEFAKCSGYFGLLFKATNTTGNWRIDEVNITFYKEKNDNAAADPTLTKGGIFTTTPYDVTITNKEEGATVFYTTDGTTPNGSSSSFTGASKTLSISATTTVKARAFIAAKDSSEIVSATYTYEASIANTKETAYSVAKAKNLIDKGSAQLATTRVYVTGNISEVSSFSEQYGSITYWISDTTGTSKDFQIYAGFNADSTAFSAQTDLAVGDSVTVYGLIKKYGSTYEMDKNNYIVSRKGSAKATATITASPKTSLIVGGAADSFAVTYNGDGTLAVSSSAETVATVSITDTIVTVTPVATGTTTITISAPETDNYQAATKKYTLSVIELAYLPFYFNEGFASIATTPGMSQTGLGSDYKTTTNTKLKFDGTGDNLVIAVNQAPTSLAFAIKGNSFSGGTFDVQTSADGAAYATLQSFTSLPGSDTIIGLPLNSDVRFVKFVYTQKASGNVGLGHIAISCMTPATMTIDPANKWATFSTDFPVDIPANVYAYGVSVDSLGKTVLTKFGGDSIFAIDGKSAVLLYTDNAEGYTMTYYDGMSVMTPVDTYAGKNMLQPAIEPIAAGEFYNHPDFDNYILQNKAGVVAFYKVISTNTLPANKAYLWVDKKVSTGKVDLDFGQPTGIEDKVNANANANAIYNLQGVRVNDSYKGIVIQNGKKYLRK